MKTCAMSKRRLTHVASTPRLDPNEPVRLRAYCNRCGAPGAVTVGGPEYHTHGFTAPSFTCNLCSPVPKPSPEPEKPSHRLTFFKPAEFKQPSESRADDREPVG
jgi:hypothetical protein